MNTIYSILSPRPILITLLICYSLLSLSLQAQSVDNCDALTGWYGGSTLSIDTNDKKEGTGSLKSLGNGVDDFNKKLDPISISETDILRFWYYVADVNLFSASNQVEIGSGNGPDVNEYSWSLNELVNGWNLIELPINSAAITGGTPDLNAINWFRIYRYKNDVVTTKIDDIQFVSKTGVTTLFADDFSDGNYSDWTTAGTWSVSNEQLKGEANSNIFIGDYYDFEFETDLMITADESRTGVVFRVSAPGTEDNFTGYFAFLRNTDNRTLVELQRVDNGRIDIANEMTLDVEKDVMQHLKIVCKGPNIWVFVNDTITPAISEYDPEYSSGYIGLKTIENYALFDNVKLTTVKYVTPPEPVVRDWSWVKGADFVSSNSVNSTQMMEEYDPVLIDRELSYARFYGFNTIRVNLHWLLWDKDKSALLANFEDLLQKAYKYEIKVIPVLFDDCGDIDPPHLAPYNLPTPGIYNSQMNTNPGSNIRDNEYDTYKTRLKSYVQDVVNAHKNDSRILFWTPINEPSHFAPSQRIASDVYSWIKETGTTILVSSSSGGFLGGKYSDFYTFHTYTNNSGADGGSEHLNTGCFNRATMGSSVVGQDFVEMVNYFTDRQTGFVIKSLTIGRDNSRFPWDSPLDSDEPTIPFHGFIYPDGHPWSVTEAEKLNPALDTIPLFVVEYFTGNFATSKKLSITSRIDFNLGDETGTGSPDASAGIPKDDFSIRWLGKILPKSTGTYTFYVDCDNIARIWIDDTQVLNKVTNSQEEISGTIELTENQFYDIKIDYIHANGDASLHVQWEGTKLAKQVLLGNYYEIEEEPAISSSANAIGTLGAPFTYSITATSNPISFSADELPAGLSLNTSTGVISGLPSSLGTFSVSVSASNLSGSASQVVSFVIVEDPFVPFINSVPLVHEVISTTNTIFGSTPITVKKLTFSSKNNANTVYAIMAYPMAAGTYPGIMFLHGGGGNAESVAGYVNNFASLGYVAIACDLPGICGSDNTPNTTGPFKTRPVGEAPRFDVGIGAGNSILVDAEVAAMEAFNFLKTQSNVDSTKMGVSGFSWGGYSTTMVSGLLRDKVKAAYAVFGCGYYEKGSFWKTMIEGLSDTDRNTWLTYLDAGRRAPNITAPYFLEAASNDTYFWPEAVKNTLDAIPGTKNHTWGPNLNHSPVPSSITMMKNYFNYYLKDSGYPFANVTISSAIADEEGNGIISIDVNIPSEVSISKAQLYYSVPTSNWQSRNWIPLTAVLVSENKYSVSLPVDIVNQNVDYYAYVKDSRTIVTSSYMYNTSNVSTNIIELTDDVFNIYPNPNNGIFNISINSKEPKNYNFTLFDLNGNKIIEERYLSNDNFIINHPSLLSGLYILKLSSVSELYTKKIMIY